VISGLAAGYKILCQKKLIKVSIPEKMLMLLKRYSTAKQKTTAHKDHQVITTAPLLVVFSFHLFD